jgi:hypothetical protein
LGEYLSKGFHGRLVFLHSPRPRPGLTGGPALLLAFAFAVMADPVSSVAYAIEAALRALEGNLGLLLPTMATIDQLETRT